MKNSPGGGHDCEVDLLGEDCGGEDEVDGGAEPRVGEEGGRGEEEEGGEAAEAAQGHEQVQRGPAAARLAEMHLQGSAKRWSLGCVNGAGRDRQKW